MTVRTRCRWAKSMECVAIWKEIYYDAERSCLQELCHASKSVQKSGMMPERKQYGNFVKDR